MELNEKPDFELESESQNELPKELKDEINMGGGLSNLTGKSSDELTGIPGFSEAKKWTEEPQNELKNELQKELESFDPQDELEFERNEMLKMWENLKTSKNVLRFLRKSDEFIKLNKEDPSLTVSIFLLNKLHLFYAAQQATCYWCALLPEVESQTKNFKPFSDLTSSDDWTQKNGDKTNSFVQDISLVLAKSRVGSSSFAFINDDSSSVFFKLKAHLINKRLLK